MSLWVHTRRVTTRQAQNWMNRFTYVYVLQSEIESKRFYIGHTTDSSVAAVYDRRIGAPAKSVGGHRPPLQENC
jgi:hypothetical protein